METMKKSAFLLTALLIVFCLTGCTPGDQDEQDPVISELPGLEPQPAKEDLAALFTPGDNFPAALSNSWKIWGHRNALITQGFGADPTAMAYKDRVYIYASNDDLMASGSGGVQSNVEYNAGIRGLRVISSADLANWTDHGLINIGGVPEWINPLYLKADGSMPTAVTSFPTRSWAPSAVWKKIDGGDKFFVYFSDSGDGIGVITSDSPTGPWTSPLPRLLIDRQTKNCETVTSVFDPGVMVDDDGKGYMFFGGGGPGNARRVQLGPDMISLAGDPEEWDVPDLFEDNEIIKINEMYYYSYCDNQGYAINYMTGWDPLGEYNKPKKIMNSPQSQFSTADENNHHCIFQFKGGTYIAYHASNVARAMGLGRYRSTQIEKVPIDDNGDISTIRMTRKGVDQIEKLNPYIPNEAETIGIMGGVYTRPDADAGNGMLVTSIDSGDWLAVYGVDFGSSGAKKIIVKVRTPDTPDYTGAIEIRLDPEGEGKTGDTDTLNATNTASIKNGRVVGRLRIKAKPGESGKYATVTADLDETVTGTHDLVFVFYSSLGAQPITIGPNGNLIQALNKDMHKNGFEFDQWQFIK